MIHRIVARLGFWPRTLVALTLTATIVTLGVEGRAVADTSAYELYCPGSPVGNIAFNGVITTGSLSPSAPAKGESFSITDFQTTFSVPIPIVDATAALGNTTISGYIGSILDVSGAKPAKLTENESLSSTIPSTVTNPLPVLAPSSPVVVGPLNATGSSVVVTVNAHVTLAVSVTPGESGRKVRCLIYPNNATASGLDVKKPSGSPVAPVIAKSG